MGMARTTGLPIALIALAVGGALALQSALHDELRPPAPVWTLPLTGPWDGSPDSPSLREGCRILLVKAHEGETDALGRLDRRLHALARDRGGLHPLAHVDAWRGLIREVWGRPELPEAGIRSITWESHPFTLGRIRYAVLVPGSLSPDRITLVLSIPGAGEDPAEHLRRRWPGARDGIIVLAPGRRDESERHPGELLIPLRNARERWAIDDDRIVVAGLGGGARAAARLAALFASRFAGLVLGRDTVPDVELRENIDSLPVLHVGPEEDALPRVARWLENGEDGRPIRRDLFRRRIDWRVGSDMAASLAYWILLVGRHPDARASRIVAEVGDDNRIHIRTEGLERFRVLLNDRLVDLDRPVILRINGDQVVSRVPTRSVRRVVDAVESLGDLSAVFPEWIDVTVE